MLKILFFGDITGSPGRDAVKQNLPQILESEKPDLVLANVENLAHGKGVTVKTLEEIIRIGVNGFTSGNHIYSKKELSEEVFAKYPDLIVRSANFPPSCPGKNAIVLETSKGKVLVGNFMGQVFMEKQFHEPVSSPFTTATDWLNEYKPENYAASLVDFHAEATSEKLAFGYFLEGKVSAVIGTHTHVPTADAKVLPGGTAYITDVGMCGAAGSILGVKRELSLERFLTGSWVPFDIPEDPEASELSYVIIEVDETSKKAKNIRLVHKIVSLK